MKMQGKAKIELNDLKIRLILIPAFGLAIPQLTGLFGDLSLRSGWYWFGVGYFILLAFFIYQGNRFFLIKQRENFDWFEHPVRKVMLLLFANVFYTAPVTVAMLAGWYAAAGFPETDWDVVTVVTLANVICVIFVTHTYETVYLIQQRTGDRVKFAQLERAKAESELEALKSQIDPHFMFNSLNTLSWLIENNTEKALEFNDHLADVYRYILINKDRELVLLKEEIEFLNHYYGLLQLRFGNAIQLESDLPEARDSFLIPPISLQLLLENAVKHNEFSETNPLRVKMQLADGILKMENEIRKRHLPKPSAKIGLKNLRERFHLLTGRQIEIRQGDGQFSVHLPLLSSQT